jgi:hypothetical protein
MNHLREGRSWKKKGKGRSRTVGRIREEERGGELMVRDYIYGFSLTREAGEVCEKLDA